MCNFPPFFQRVSLKAKNERLFASKFLWRKSHTYEFLLRHFLLCKRLHIRASTIYIDAGWAGWAILYTVRAAAGSIRRDAKRAAST
uniref:Uncharacterized protein n=1 Tax=Trichogramma kaykai TaxID=54128 RepID=A0ABD2VXV5_9HYME